VETGLYFGSFNPIHIGHMAIANYLVEFTGLKQIWFVVSPHNPLKQKTSLLNDYQRLEMVHMAIDDDPRFRASDIEFNMPKPSYTIDTLTYLSEKYPDREFRLIMGSDNLYFIHKWKNYNNLLDEYKIIVYPRPGYPDDIERLPVLSDYGERIDQINAPLMEISSSFIRKAVKEGKNICHFLPEKVFKYMDEMNFYKK
jgi:nicotinate-nucleotide adenylyltransferase